MLKVLARLFETKTERASRQRQERINRAIRLQAERRLAEKEKERELRSMVSDRIDTKAGETVWYDSIQK